MKSPDRSDRKEHGLKPLSDIAAPICSTSRRDFLRKTLQCSAPALLLVNGLLPLRTLAAAAPRSSIDVRDKGARGDGRSDDTNAFQSAIDQLPASGGAVQVPDGTYLIDATRSIRMRDNTQLLMNPGARLQAMPSSMGRTNIVLIQGVSNVRIYGGQIIGERGQHQGSSGEWGHGIYVKGARQVAIESIRISQCWGDGICIGALGGQHGEPLQPSSDIHITHVICDGNRRQGLSIGAARAVNVTASQFINTAGTKPACGIDLEPNKGEHSQDIDIVDCVMSGNQGSGLQIYQGVSNTTVRRCKIQHNQGYGLLAAYTQHSLITLNTISGNGMTGVLVRSGASDLQIKENILSNNTTAHLRQALNNLKNLTGGGANSDTDIHVTPDTKSIVISGNTTS